jgi:hypothetical protein
MGNARTILIRRPGQPSLRVQIEGGTTEIAAFYDTGKGRKQKLSGGRWITWQGRPLYIKGGKIEAGAGATPGHPKELGDVAGRVGANAAANKGRPIQKPDVAPAHMKLAQAAAAAEKHHQALKARGVTGREYEHALDRSIALKRATNEARSKRAKELVAQRTENAQRRTGAAKETIAKSSAKATAGTPKFQTVQSHAGLSPREVDHYHQKLSTTWQAKLTPQQADAVKRYAANPGSMAGGKPLDAALATARLPERTEVYRGVKDIRALGLDPNKLVGATIRDRGPLLTSFTPTRGIKALGKEKNGAVLRIVAPAGSHGASLAGFAGAGTDGHPIVFSKGSKLKVTGVYRHHKDGLIIDAELSHGD